MCFERCFLIDLSIRFIVTSVTKLSINICQVLKSTYNHNTSHQTWKKEMNFNCWHKTRQWKSKKLATTVNTAMKNLVFSKNTRNPFCWKSRLGAWVQQQMTNSNSQSETAIKETSAIACSPSLSTAISERELGRNYHLVLLKKWERYFRMKMEKNTLDSRKRNDNGGTLYCQWRGYYFSIVYLVNIEK